jgi:hypothetical protein
MRAASMRVCKTPRRSFPDRHRGNTRSPAGGPWLPQPGLRVGGDSRHEGLSWDGADAATCTMVSARILSRLHESKEGPRSMRWGTPGTKHGWSQSTGNCVRLLILSRVNRTTVPERDPMLPRSSGKWVEACMTTCSHLPRDQDGGGRGFQRYQATHPLGESGLSGPCSRFLHCQGRRRGSWSEWSL